MRPPRGSAVMVLATLAVVAGCTGGPQPPRKGHIFGSVTLDGKPLAAGNVRFIALDGGGVNLLAPVQGGAYDLPEGQGLVKGRYRVEFSAWKLGPPFPSPDFPGQMVQDRIETLPARYHRESTLVLDYDPDDPKPYNAALTSR